MYWYEFKFAACDFATCDFATMHKDCFCGEAGPRSIFTIHAIHAYLIQPFSHFKPSSTLKRWLRRVMSVP